ncbi:MAG: hypothetical protein ABI852_00850 [Gemmatimonadaceae bacterium]
MTRQELEQQFVQNLRDIEIILSRLCYRNGLIGDDADEFSSWAKFRLIENDYAILAKFKNRSKLKTYLTAVLATQFSEYRIHEWGRWRPSAAARLAGALSIQLERLLTRDGMTLAQAGEHLRTAGCTTKSDGELAQLAKAFPMRTPQRPVQSVDSPVDAAAPDLADASVERAEDEQQVASVKVALNAAMAELSAQDRLLLRLRHMEAMSIADIARGLALPQKPLYRQLTRAEKLLRTCLERAGVTLDIIRQLPFGFSDGPM